MTKLSDDNFEVFYARANELRYDGQTKPNEAGWFWQYPLGWHARQPVGPFKTEQEALAHARKCACD